MKPTTMYIASLWSQPKITPVEVVRTTKSSYWTADQPDRRHARASSYEAIYETFEEAKARLVEVQEKEVSKYENHLRGAQNRLEYAKSLRCGDDD